MEALLHGANLIYANLLFPSSDAFAVRLFLVNLHEKSNTVCNMKAIKSTIIILSSDISIILTLRICHDMNLFSFINGATN